MSNITVDQKMNRPANVTYGIVFLLAAMLIGIVLSYNSNVVSQMRALDPTVAVSSTFLIGNFLFAFIIRALICYKIFQGRNYARLIILFTTLCYVVMLTKGWSTVSHHPASVLPTILNVIGLAFLFFGSGSKWFSKKLSK